MALELAPVRLPKYVDRPQIVTRSGRHQLELAEFDRWGEPLNDIVTRVIAQNLMTLLGTTDIYTEFSTGVGSPQTRVLLDFSSFDATVGEKVVITVRWSLLTKGNGSRKNEVRTFEQSVKSEDYSEIAAAFSAALSDLSQAIAQSVTVSDS